MSDRNAAKYVVRWYCVQCGKGYAAKRLRCPKCGQRGAADRPIPIAAADLTFNMLRTTKVRA